MQSLVTQFSTVVRNLIPDGKSDSEPPSAGTPPFDLLEPLEARVLLSAAVEQAAVDLNSLIATPAVEAGSLAGRWGGWGGGGWGGGGGGGRGGGGGGGGGIYNGTVKGLTPAQVRNAYGFDQIAGDGTGQTIAIVDAYDDPNILADLQKFDATFGLPDPTFTKVMPGGKAKSNSDWSLEIALDVEWAHAIAPGASILLVEAPSASLTDLLNAVTYAANQAGVVAVSMSWGTSEFSGETSYDKTFTHTGVTYVASSGDSGSPADWPGVSPNVLSVGGTTLKTASDGTYLGETGWSGSGGGISRYEARPTYQSSISITGGRLTPDVAYDANPSSGFAVYDSVVTGGRYGWFEVGGTSAGAPQWAGLIAIADQARDAGGLAPLTGRTQTLPSLYSFSAADFHDITSGSNGKYSAKTGYDLVTGRGSPVANVLISDLASKAVTLAAGTLAASSTGTRAATSAAQPARPRDEAADSAGAEGVAPAADSTDSALTAADTDGPAAGHAAGVQVALGYEPAGVAYIGQGDTGAEAAPLAAGSPASQNDQPPEDAKPSAMDSLGVDVLREVAALAL